jgi:hypothetical protein
MTFRNVLCVILLLLTVVHFYLPKDKTCPSFWHGSPARTIVTVIEAALFGGVLCLLLVGK